MMLSSARFARRRAWQLGASAIRAKEARPVCQYFSATARGKKPQLCIVNLKGSGLSILERLCLEEWLVANHSASSAASPPQHWLLVGTHEPTQHRRLTKVPMPKYRTESRQQHSEHFNPSCMVMVKPTAPFDDVNFPLVKQDGVLLVQYQPTAKNEDENTASSLGGSFEDSVVLDHTSLMTTFLFANNNNLPSTNDPHNNQQHDKPSTLQHLEQFVTDKLWKPVLTALESRRRKQPHVIPDADDYGEEYPENSDRHQQEHRRSPLTMVMDSASCSFDNGSTGKGQLRLDDLGIDPSVESLPPVREDALPFSASHMPYYFLGDQPVGLVSSSSSNGNKQAANDNDAKSTDVSSYLVRNILYWDYADEHLEYLKPPMFAARCTTAPLLRLSEVYQDTSTKRNNKVDLVKLVETLQRACQEEFEVTSVLTARDVLAMVEQQQQQKGSSDQQNKKTSSSTSTSGFQDWFEKQCAHKVIDL